MLLTCVVARHDVRLIALAAIICLSTALITAWLLPRARTCQVDRTLTCVVLSLGAWTTHFVAMLGYEPGLLMTYDPVLTIVSAVLVLAGVGLGLELWRTASTLGIRLGGMLTGLSIAAMHYAGMQAVSVPGTLAYSTALVAGSLLAAAMLGTAAFTVLGHPPTRRRGLAGAGLLVACIVALHFIGIASVSINDGRLDEANGLARSWLALLTGLASLVLAILFCVAIGIRTLAQRRQQSQAAERLREFAEASFEALAICSPAGTIIDANLQLLTLCGAAREQIIGEPLGRLFRPGEYLDAQGGVSTGLLLNDVPVETQARIIGAGTNRRTVVSLRDIRERLQSQRRIHHMAHHDALTGLPNRVVVTERLLLEIARCRRNDTGFAVLYLDLDRFKPINDVYGHAVGDALLQQVAERLRGELRSDDLAARLGGDEFAVIQSGLRPAEPSQTVGLARRLLKQISAPYDLDGTEVTISCSIGLSIYPTDAADADGLLRGADIALYRAKETGRATFAFFRPEMENALRDRHALEQDLRSAIGKGELSLAWQPQATADEVVMTGFEALLRWHHLERGNVPPDIFIPIAESSGIILQLGDWALRTACEEASRWANRLRVAVNVSPFQIQQPDFPDVVAGILAETGLDPFRLELEVTESMFLSNPDRVLAVLGALKQLGIRVSLDDFGTGYSSLGTLRQFPFDKIKLDRSFVSRMTEDAQSAAIVQAVLGLSRGLGLPVVAEGVETASQLGALRAAQCDEVQGYLIGRPQPITMFHDIVHEPHADALFGSTATLGPARRLEMPEGINDCTARVGALVV